MDAILLLVSFAIVLAGALLWRHQLRASDLRFPRRKPGEGSVPRGAGVAGSKHQSRAGEQPKAAFTGLAQASTPSSACEISTH